MTSTSRALPAVLSIFTALLLVTAVSMAITGRPQSVITPADAATTPMPAVPTAKAPAAVIPRAATRERAILPPRPTAHPLASTAARKPAVHHGKPVSGKIRRSPSLVAALTPVTVTPTVPASGAASPKGDLPGWHLVLSQDFTKNARLGQFSSVYPGWADYDGAQDTSGHGTYDSATTTSVSGGVLDEYLHTQGTPQVMALTPPGASNQTYGRYAVRFRSDSIPGYKIAWLLWPRNDVWSQGELDFPEAGLDSTISGYAHDVTGSPGHNAWAVDTGRSMTAWHTAVLEWSPAGLRYILDGRSWTTTRASAIPRNPMNWILQTETADSGPTPGASSSGHIKIDWVAAWSAA